MEPSGRSFTYLFVAAVAATLGASFVLHRADLVYYDNDLIRHYQLAKLERAAPFDTIVVGDSSAGNGLDASLLTRLSGRPTLNLALTGSFGLEGSLNMIRHAVRASRPANVVIVHTLDMWARPFSLLAYYESEQGLPAIGVEHPFLRNKTTADYLQYVVNPREIGRYVRHRLRGPQLQYTLDREHDYLAQRPSTIANGGIAIAPGARLARGIHPDKLAVFEIIDRYCELERLNCLYVHGPLYDRVFHASRAVADEINAALASIARHVRVVPDVLTFGKADMGDSIDHVHPAAKAESTRRYYDLLRSYLR